MSTSIKGEAEVQKRAVFILAAGLGKRMRSSKPKVLHEIAGKPLIYHILRRIVEVCPDVPVGIVVGHGREAIESYILQEVDLKTLKITFVFQQNQCGTGNAVRCAMDSQWGQDRLAEKSTILVLPGDIPLLSCDVLERMMEPLKQSEVLRLLTCELDDPSGYGRVIRRAQAKKGSVLRIVEERDATEEERLTSEVAVSIYLFKSEFLSSSLKKLSNSNAQGEYYLTDLVGIASKKGRACVGTLVWKKSEDLRGVNDLWELAQAAKVMNERILRRWAGEGVKFVDPSTTWVDCSVRLSEGVVVSPGVSLFGMTYVRESAILGPNVSLKDVDVGAQTYLKVGTIAESSKIESQATVGPYAHLRPGSLVGYKAKIGNFVELKKTHVGAESSIAHLSYLGDAVVGAKVNIGCGFITCNFDGRIVEGERKHRTIIEDDVFLGSDCQAVAPVKIGKGAYIASGSTITEDVPPGAMAIARSRQVNKADYVQKLKRIE